jgi:hypothetical protein
MSELIFIKCYFFLDTIFLGFYTFVNCKVSLAGSMSTRQRENRKNGNQESSSKEASEEGSQENSKKEVSRQRNRQHNRGTPKASPDVFLAKALSLVFMRLRRPIIRAGKFSGRAGAGIANRCHLSIAAMRRPDFPLPVFVFRRQGSLFSPWLAVTAWQRENRPGVIRRRHREGTGARRTWTSISLPKWYRAMTPSDETVAP